MSSNPPTVTARYHLDPVMHQSLCDAQPSIECEGVTVEVTFALGQHQAALTILDRAVAQVRAQIADTAQRGQRP